MIQSTYLCYFAYQAQKLTIHRDFNLISSLGEIQDGLKDLKASSSSTTQKIYLIFFRRSKDFHSRQNSFETPQHINICFQPLELGYYFPFFGLWFIERGILITFLLYKRSDITIEAQLFQFIMDQLTRNTTFGRQDT